MAVAPAVLATGCGDDEAPESGPEAGRDVTLRIAVNIPESGAEAPAPAQP